jgi:hypothetical protein
MAARDVDQPILVVCEGPNDCGLIDHLLKEYKISGIQTYCPKHASAGDGLAAIPKTLKLLLDAGQLKKVQGLALIVDANGNPAVRFNEAAAMLATVNFRVTQPYRLEPGIPTAAVYLFPESGKSGCLENLLVDVIAQSDANLISSVNAYAVAVAKPLTWPPNKQAKMRIHSLMAACCEEDPATSLGWVWHKKGNPMPLTSPKFGDLVKFLRDLEQVAAFVAVAAALVWS